jgi:hypothetical protein
VFKSKFRCCSKNARKAPGPSSFSLNFSSSPLNSILSIDLYAVYIILACYDQEIELWWSRSPASLIR